MTFGLVLLVGVIYFSSHVLLSGIKDNMSQGKPFDLAFNYVFGGDKEKHFIPFLALFIIFIISYGITSGGTKLFMFTMSVATLSMIIFNLFLFPTLLWVLGGKKK